MNDSEYRLLDEGEIIQRGDQIFNDHTDKWEPATNCFGEPAPSPLYTSHRLYRRLIAAQRGEVEG